MKRFRFQAAWERLSGRLRGELARRVVWVTDARRDLRGGASDTTALVAVLGREHYRERRKSYPVRGWRDLDRVLRLELAGAPPTLTLVGPLVDDRREVTLYELGPEALERTGRTAWLVPESLALSLTLPPQRVATVERDGLRYFLAASGVSQVAGGAVLNAGLFAIAVGVDVSEEPIALSREDIAGRLLGGLKKLPAAAWLRLLSPTLRTDLGIAWRPLATVTAVAFVGYLGLASMYLSLTESLRQRELASLGPDVAMLLETQRTVERLALEQQGLATVLDERVAAYPVWRVVAQAWQKGAALNGLALADGRLTLRGSAPVATDVLAALAAEAGVEDARFAAPVRQTGRGEQFVITLSFADGGSRG